MKPAREVSSRLPTLLPFRAGNDPRGHRRYPLRRHDGNEDFALDAYAGAEGNVDRWIAAARAHNRALTVAAIPDAERAYRGTYVSALQSERPVVGPKLPLV